MYRHSLILTLKI